MLKAIKQFFVAQPYQDEAHNAYIAIVAQARTPAFYRDWQVPDTVDGRFDVIVLHLFLAIRALRAEGSAQALEFARVLSEIFFADMDRSLREMGSTDTGTGMRVKNMAQAFYGRVQAYSDAWEGDLKTALARNLYREKPVSAESLDAVAGYMRAHAQLSVTEMLSGAVRF